ncbi:hypothetical protein B0T25DRAFT_544392 [Lasiosphaeria hispida]|uniref:Uncharacterized protein n=1 Tax=Lasiosphaeria hispida TaxID=260671 RepID=A0AAJ0MED7_9PEZI|nr:hypothetical protein B0T25DRAFT_544392 [Lasiosphaeria hispida]
MMVDLIDIAHGIFDNHGPLFDCPGGTERCERDVERFLQSVRMVDAKKVFCVRLPDGEKLYPVGIAGCKWVVTGETKGAVWCRKGKQCRRENCGGCVAPVREIAMAILQRLSVQGWVNLDI